MAGLPKWIEKAAAKVGGWFRNLWREVERACRYIWELLKSAPKHAASITTVVTVFIAALTVRYTAKQWEEMQAARRPWVGMSERLVLKTPPSFSVTGPLGSLAAEPEQANNQIITASFDISGTIQNFGSSPARKEVEQFDIIDAEKVRYLWREGNCLAAGDASRGSSGSSSPHPTRVIFPSVSLPMNTTLQVLVRYDPSGVTIEAHGLLRIPNRSELSDPLWVVGCIAYQDTVGGMHYTKVLYRSNTPIHPVLEPVLLSPPFSYRPFSEFVMEDSDSD